MFIDFLFTKRNLRIKEKFEIPHKCLRKINLVLFASMQIREYSEWLQFLFILRDSSKIIRNKSDTLCMSSVIMLVGRRFGWLV